MPQNREREIEDAVIAHPEILGFPNAAAIRTETFASGGVLGASPARRHFACVVNYGITAP
jgi:hypothetical protein